LLAAAITNMHGVGGKPGWAWIFILEVPPLGEKPNEDGSH
jgi:hypothetical protein